MSPSAAAPWRSTALITLGAVGVFALYSLLPSGGKLTHMDFLADNATVLELCNPLNNQPLPVVTGSLLPVTMGVLSIAPAEREGVVRGAFELRSISGKPVTPSDLLSIDGRKIRLTISGQTPDSDPASSGITIRGLTASGQWDFSFRSPGSGPYRITAEFTPIATGKPLEASAEIKGSGLGD